MSGVCQVRLSASRVLSTSEQATGAYATRQLYFNDHFLACGVTWDVILRLDT